MPVQAHDKYCIALRQLETALRLFREADDLYAVITLAGAAEEILGKLVAKGGGDPSVTSLAQAAAAIHKHLFGEEAKTKDYVDRANRARNAVKHLDAGGWLTEFDAREEAVDMLNRAIDNHWLLKESLTSAMEAFKTHATTA